jgi:parvulin-like peptidyl-prolyl isomerase
VRKLLRPLAALGAVLFALVGLAACGGVPGGSVAQVNGTPITNSTFKHWLAVASSSQVAATGKAVIPEPPNFTACVKHLEEEESKLATKGKKRTAKELKTQCEQQYKTLLSEVLAFLISSNWVIGEGSSLGVKVSDKEVKKQFDKIKEEQFPKSAEFEKFLQTSGQTVSDLLLRVKLNLLSQKIQQKIAKQNPTVTHADIEKYYKENSSRFGTPEKRDVRIVLTKDQGTAEKAKKEIESGKSFASVAKARSTDPASKANGGLLKGVIKGEEEKALDEAIFAAKLHALGGPVKTPFGYYVFDVENMTPGSQTPLKSVEASVKQQLIATKRQKALSEFVKKFKKKWTEKTECRSEYLVPDCKEYKAPKSSTGTTSTPTP